MSAVRRDDADLMHPGPSLALVLPVFELVIVVVAWASLIMELAKLNPNTCLNVAANTPGPKYVVTAVAGLLIGRYVGALRFFRRHPSAAGHNRDAASVLLGRATLALVFFALVPIFIYEAVGVYQPVNGYEPITYYVRCAVWIDDHLANGIRTMLILLALGFLFGQWLWAWHPEDGRTGDLRPVQDHVG